VYCIRNIVLAQLTSHAAPVMLSPRGQIQNFGPGVGLKDLASAGLDLIVLLCNRAFFGKSRLKFGNFVNFSGNNLKSYVNVNHYLVLFS